MNDIFTIFGSLEGTTTGLATNFKELATEKAPVPKSPLNQQQPNEPPRLIVNFLLGTFSLSHRVSFACRVSPAKKKNTGEPEATPTPTPGKKRKNEEASSVSESLGEASTKKRKLENGHAEGTFPASSLLC